MKYALVLVPVLLGACASRVSMPADPPAPSVTASAPIDAEGVNGRVKRALALMGTGNLDEAARLLNEAHALDPSDESVTYELATARMLRKEPQQAIALLKPIVESARATPHFYQLLGNAYALAGAGQDAMATYAHGLERFPKSGRLLYERGAAARDAGDSSKAAADFVRGIAVEPEYPSNYFAAAELFARNADRGRAVLYGEVFMNLDVDSRRSTVMRTMLWDAYASAVRITKDGPSFEAATALSMTSTIAPAARRAKGPPQPRELRYEDVHAARLKLAKIGNASPGRGNEGLLNAWHARMNDAGYFEAYDRWLFDRPQASFADYCKQNGAVCKRLENWLENNPVPVAAAEPVVIISE